MNFTRKKILLFLGSFVSLLLGYLGLIGRKKEELCEDSDYNPERENNRTIHNAYGSSLEPPVTIDESYCAKFYFPPEYLLDKTKTRSFSLNLFPLSVQISKNIAYDAWTFEGMVPGPILRVREGDILNIQFKNSSPEPHSLHFHGSHNPNQDGWEPVSGYGQKLYKLEAGPFGVHPYHCHVPPLAQHISKGLFGVLLVDPKKPRTPAHEFVLVFSAWDLGKNKRVYTWNGIANLYDRFPLKVPVGEKVRIYLVNMLEKESVFTFHLHSKTFDIIRSLGFTNPESHSDVVTLGTTERVIIEFTLPYRGRYMFHPHESWMAENGGMGWIVAV